MARAGKRPFGRDEVVEALLDAANRLFAVAGPADVSLRAIAREAGVNHGLVHRHFGTRDVLVDRLLERIAAEWTAKVQSSADFGRALDSILGDPAEAEQSASTWLRLLAWSLLTDPPGRSGEVQRRYATLDLLPELLRDRAPGDAATTTAAALALVFGWRFFHPYIRAALHLEGERFEALHDAIRRSLRKLSDP
jgi:AcrR family transcriptional regulator